MSFQCSFPAHAADCWVKTVAIVQETAENDQETAKLNVLQRVDGERVGAMYQAIQRTPYIHHVTNLHTFRAVKAAESNWNIT